MHFNLNQVTAPSHDVAASVAFYQKLGLRLIVSSAHYARFESALGDATFSVHLLPSSALQQAQPSAACGRVLVYFEATSAALLDAQVAALQAQGLTFSRLPRDESWLWREARLHDPAGNEVCLYWAGENRKNPPWRLDSAATPPPSAA